MSQPISVDSDRSQLEDFLTSVYRKEVSIPPDGTCHARAISNASGWKKEDLELGIRAMMKVRYREFCRKLVSKYDKDHESLKGDEEWTNFVDLYGKITPNRYGWGTYVHTLMASVVLERPVFVLMIGEELRVLEYSLDPKICVSFLTKDHNMYKEHKDLAVNGVLSNKLKNLAKKGVLVVFENFHYVSTTYDKPAGITKMGEQKRSGGSRTGAGRKPANKPASKSNAESIDLANLIDKHVKDVNSRVIDGDESDYTNFDIDKKFDLNQPHLRHGEENGGREEHPPSDTDSGGEDGEEEGDGEPKEARTRWFRDNKTTPVNRFLLDFQDQLSNENSSIVKLVRSGQIEFHPPNALNETFVSFKNLKNKDCVIQPSAFYAPLIYVWIPHLQFPWITVTCPHCNAHATPYSRPEPRRIYDQDRIVYLFHRGYQCTSGSCKKLFNSCNPDFLSKLDRSVLYSLPFVLSYKAGVTKKVFNNLLPLVDGGFGPERQANLMSEIYHQRKDIMQAQYYYLALSLKKSREKQPSLSSRGSITSEVKVYPFHHHLNDIQGFHCRPPSATYLKHLLLFHLKNLEDYYKFSMMCKAEGNIFSVDTSYKLMNHISSEYKFGVGLYACMNEFNEVITAHFVPDNTNQSMEEALKVLKHNQNCMHGEKCQVVYTDNCCKDSNFINRVFETKGTTRKMSKLDLITENSDHSVDSKTTSVDHSNELLQPLVQLLHTKKVVIALDIETTNRKDNPRHGEWTQVVNVISIAYTIGTVTHVLVLVPSKNKINQHPFKDKRLLCFNDLVSGNHLTLREVSNLQTVLLHENSIFTGRNIKGFDIKWLAVCFKLPALTNATTVELRELYVKAGFKFDGRKDGLDAILKRVCNKYLDKSTRATNWHVENHTPQQLQYAALDAYASLICYMKLEEKINTREGLDGITATQISSSESDSDDSQPGDFDRNAIHTNDENDSLPTNRCVGDILHFIQRVTEHVHSNHPCLPFLAKSISEVIYKPNPEDVRRVMEVLRKKGIDYDEMQISSPSYFDSRIRKVIPSPHVLASALKHLLVEAKKEIFNDNTSSKFETMKKKDPSYIGIPLLSEVAIQAFEHLIEHAEKGCLSDPKGVQLYFHQLAKDGRSPKTDSDGLYLWRCVRGTNKNENFHRQLEMYWEPWNVSPEYAYFTLLSFVFRFNVRASIRNRPNWPNTGHYDNYLINEINCLTDQIHGKRKFENWSAITHFNSDKIRKHDGSPLPLFNKLQWDFFGIQIPTLPPDTRNDVRVTENLKKSQQFIANKQKSPLPVLPIAQGPEKYLYKIYLMLMYPNEFNSLTDGDESSALLNLKINNAQWAEFARRWNSGEIQVNGVPATSKFYKELLLYQDLKGPNASSSIFPKTAKQLEHYLAVSVKASLKKAMLHKVKSTVDEIKRKIEDLHGLFNSEYRDEDFNRMDHFQPAVQKEHIKLVVPLHKPSIENENSILSASAPAPPTQTRMPSLSVLESSSSPRIQNQCQSLPTVSNAVPPMISVSNAVPPMISAAATNMATFFLSAMMKKPEEPNKPVWETKKRKRQPYEVDENKENVEVAKNITPMIIATTIGTNLNHQIQSHEVNISAAAPQKRAKKSCQYEHCSDVDCKGGFSRQQCQEWQKMLGIYTQKIAKYHQDLSTYNRCQQLLQNQVQNANTTRFPPPNTFAPTTA